MSKATRERIRRQYSHGGADYDAIRIGNPRGQQLSEHDAGLFGRLLPKLVSTESRALEVGAGTGRFTLPLLEAGYRVVATDVNQAQLDVLRDKLGDSGFTERCEVRVEDIFSLSFPDRSFDLVACIHVVPRFITWDDQRDALRELARVVKPGGHILVNFRNRRSPYNLVYRGPAAQPSAVTATLNEAGLQVVERRTKHLLNGTLIERLPRFIWPLIARCDRALEQIQPDLAWDVFLLAKRPSP